MRVKFSIKNGDGFCKNVIILGIGNSSFAHADKKNLILYKREQME